MRKVVVVLEGGLVQAVYSDTPDVEVAVLDYDTFEDIEPRFESNNFFRPELDLEMKALGDWKTATARYFEQIAEWRRGHAQ
jgi:hypothetical protein